MKIISATAVIIFCIHTACVAPAALTTFGRLPDAPAPSSVLVVAAEGTYAENKEVIDVVAAAFREIDYLPYTDGTLVTPARGPEVYVSIGDTAYRRQTTLPIQTQLFESPTTDFVAVVTGRAVGGRVSKVGLSVSDRRSGQLLYTLDINFAPALLAVNARDVLAIKLGQGTGRMERAQPHTYNRYGLPEEYRTYNTSGLRTRPSTGSYPWGTLLTIGSLAEGSSNRG